MQGAFRVRCLVGKAKEKHHTGGQGPPKCLQEPDLRAEGIPPHLTPHISRPGGGPAHTPPKELSPLHSPLPRTPPSKSPPSPAPAAPPPVPPIKPRLLLGDPALSPHPNFHFKWPVLADTGAQLSLLLPPLDAPQGPGSRRGCRTGSSEIGVRGRGSVRLQVESGRRAGAGLSFPDQPHRPTVHGLNPTARRRTDTLPGGTRDSETATRSLAPLPRARPLLSSSPTPHRTPSPRAPPFPWLLPRRL